MCSKFMCLSLALGSVPGPSTSIACTVSEPPFWQLSASIASDSGPLGAQAFLYTETWRWTAEGAALSQYGSVFNWKKGQDPHPKDKIQHLDSTEDPRPLYYKTPPCVFYHENVCSKAVFGP